MKIVTTPMCREIVELAGVSDYLVNTDPDSTNADLAVVLGETKTSIPCVRVRLNTFKQIKNSINEISNKLGTTKSQWPYDNEEIAQKKFILRKKIKVKVYSNFLRDIVEDMRFSLDNEKPDFMVYPDYFKDKIIDEIESASYITVEIPSHKNAPINPIERAEMRYNILEQRLCTKL